MKLEYTMGFPQLKKYFYIRLLKLLGSMTAGTIIALLCFDIDADAVFQVVGLSWCWCGLIHLMPFFIIFYRHKKISSNASFIIDIRNRRCQFRNSATNLSFGLNEVDQIVQFLSPPAYDNRIDLLGFGHFFYWEIRLADGTVLVVSCLLLDMENFLDFRSVRAKSMFTFPPLKTIRSDSSAVR